MSWNFFKAHILDLRSLALFRILLGSYILYDTYARLSLGTYDLAWYTSDKPNHSYLWPNDSPHQAPLHKIWFYRGTARFQIVLFSVTIILALLFTVGWGLRNHYVGSWIKILFFVAVVSYQNRNMEVHDGSDSFSRHLLLWSCFLPLADVWSLDAWILNKSSRPTKQVTNAHQADRYAVSGLPCLAITLQIALMYWGTVAHRTIDNYGYRWESLRASQWLPPQLSAVHYALAGSFASRDHALNQFILQNKIVGQILTASAMGMESLAPLGCLLCYQQRHVFAFLLFTLHLGLLVTINLPNWQLVGMLIQVIWIPTHVWNNFLGLSSKENVKVDELTATYKKTDGDEQRASSSGDAVVKTARQSSSVRITPHPIRTNIVSRLLQFFFFTYMIYNWCGCRHWIKKHDNGDIGEGLRLSQYWVMYATVGQISHTVQLTGIFNTTFLAGGKTGQKENFIDLLQALSKRQTSGAEDRWFALSPRYMDEVPLDMSSRFPSPRWERAIAQWAMRSDIRRATKFSKALCRLINEDRRTYAVQVAAKGQRVPPLLHAIEVRYQHLMILPPGSKQRYAEKRVNNDHVIRVECSIGNKMKKRNA